MTEPAAVPASLPQRRLGDRTVSAVGLGCMPLSDPAMVAQRPRAYATVHAALDAGVTLLDTANIYAPSWDQMGHNERVVADALVAWDGPEEARRQVLVATKGGITRGPGESWGRDGSRDGLLRAAEVSAKQLRVDRIDLYQLHRHDGARPYAEQVEALAAVRDAGLARMIGLSNVARDQLELALELVGGPADGGIVSVQNEFSPRYRADADVLELCAERGIAFLPWSPLGGASQAADVGSRYTAFGEVAAAHGVSAQAVVLAWLLGLAEVVVPIPGSSRPETAVDSAGAATLRLSAEEQQRLDATEPARSSMYPEDVPRPPLR